MYQISEWLSEKFDEIRKHRIRKTLKGRKYRNERPERKGVDSSKTFLPTKEFQIEN